MIIKKKTNYNNFWLNNKGKKRYFRQNDNYSVDYSWFIK